MKKILVMTLSVLVLVGLTTGCGCGKKEKENKEPDITVNTEEDVIKDQVVDGLQMTNTSLTTIDGITTLITSVTNNTQADYMLREYSIIIKDEAGAVIATIPGYVGSVIKAGETKTIDSSTNADVSRAHSIEYVVQK